MLSDALVGMHDIASVRDMVKGLADFRKRLKRTPAGHEKFTEAEALEHQRLRREYDQATVLLSIDSETSIVTRHPRPDRTPLRIAFRVAEAKA